MKPKSYYKFKYILTMKNKKVIFASFLFTMLTAVSVQAQEPVKDKDAEKVEMAKRKENTDRLALTAEQKEPYKSISKKYAIKSKELKASEMDKKEKGKQFKEIRDAKMEELKTVLNENQIKTYLLIEEERKAEKKAEKSEGKKD